MVETTKKLFEQVDELLGLTVKTMDIQDLKNIDADKLQAMQLTFKMLDTAKKLSMKEAEAMSRITEIENKLKKLDEIDKKLDKLLSKKVGA